MLEELEGMPKRGTNCLGVHYTGYGNRMCTGYGISWREEQKISVWGILGTKKKRLLEIQQHAKNNII